MTAIIARVANNMEKSLAYKEQLSRYKRAVSLDFHLEGIFILYAMFEDRLSAFLYHAGVTNNNRDRFTTNKKTKLQLDSILFPRERKQYQLRKINSKIELIQRLLDWSCVYMPLDAEADFANILYKQITGTAGVGEITQTLNHIQKWTKARNELVHALLTRKPENLHDTFVALTAEGYAECRKLDNFVKSFKKHNTIRRQFNIQ